MKILTKQIDEFTSSISDEIIPKYIVYLIDDFGTNVKAKICLGDDTMKSTVSDYIATVVMEDRIIGIERKIEFEDVSFQEFKKLLN